MKNKLINVVDKYPHLDYLKPELERWQEERTVLTFNLINRATKSQHFMETPHLISDLITARVVKKEYALYTLEGKTKTLRQTADKLEDLRIPFGAVQLEVDHNYVFI